MEEPKVDTDEVVDDICRAIEEAFDPLRILSTVDPEGGGGRDCYALALAHMDLDYDKQVEQRDRLLDRVTRELRDTNDAHEVMDAPCNIESTAFFGLGFLFGMKRAGAPTGEIRRVAEAMAEGMKQGGLNSGPYRFRDEEKRAAKAG